ncbi:MAG: hypothetical protein AAF770_03260 [Bacteroidota bacterium]
MLHHLLSSLHKYQGYLNNNDWVTQFRYKKKFVYYEQIYMQYYMHIVRKLISIQKITYRYFYFLLLTCLYPFNTDGANVQQASAKENSKVSKQKTEYAIFVLGEKEHLFIAHPVLDLKRTNQEPIAHVQDPFVRDKGVAFFATVLTGIVESIIEDKLLGYQKNYLKFLALQKGISLSLQTHQSVEQKNGKEIHYLLFSYKRAQQKKRGELIMIAVPLLSNPLPEWSEKTTTRLINQQKSIEAPYEAEEMTYAYIVALVLWKLKIIQKNKCEFFFKSRTEQNIRKKNDRINKNSPFITLQFKKKFFWSKIDNMTGIMIYYIRKGSNPVEYKIRSRVQDGLFLPHKQLFSYHETIDFFPIEEKKEAIIPVKAIQKWEKEADYENDLTDSSHASEEQAITGSLQTTLKNPLFSQQSIFSDNPADLYNHVTPSAPSQYSDLSTYKIPINNSYAPLASQSNNSIGSKMGQEEDKTHSMATVIEKKDTRVSDQFAATETPRNHDESQTNKITPKKKESVTSNLKTKKIKKSRLNEQKEIKNNTQPRSYRANQPSQEFYPNRHQNIQIDTSLKKKNDTDYHTLSAIGLIGFLIFCYTSWVVNKRKKYVKRKNLHPTPLVQITIPEWADTIYNENKITIARLSLSNHNSFGNFR